MALRGRIFLVLICPSLNAGEMPSKGSGQIVRHSSDRIVSRMPSLYAHRFDRSVTPIFRLCRRRDELPEFFHVGKSLVFASFVQGAWTESGLIFVLFHPSCINYVLGKCQAWALLAKGRESLFLAARHSPWPGAGTHWAGYTARP